MGFNKFVKAFWYMSNNFGDNLNYYLIKAVSGKEPVYVENRKGERHYIVCGSIITESNAFTTVWGAGAAWHQDTITDKAEFIAVRGELTKKLLAPHKREDVLVGDPALFMPMFYHPPLEKKHKYGIIPHWKDIEKVIWMNLPDVKIISPLQNVQDVINDIVSCEFILSTSLHGLILSDAYKVPNKWLDLGTDIGGDDFKFKDYYSTTDTPTEQPIQSLSFKDCTVKKYNFDLVDLLNSSPL